MLTGDNGILKQAANAREQSEKEKIKEQIKLDIMEKQVGKEGKDLTEDELTDIILKYGEITGSGDDIKGKVIKTTPGGYEIPVEDVYTGEVKKEDPGIYNSNDELIVSWDDLVNKYEFDISGESTSETKKTMLIEIISKNNLDAKKVVIDDSVTSIATGRFQQCASLETVKLSKNLVSIGNGAFYACVNLDSMTLPEGLQSIGDNAFSSCPKITSIVIPDSVTEIGSYPWPNSNIEKIVIGSGIKEVRSDMFVPCINLREVELKEGITKIGGRAFGSGQFKTDELIVNIPSTVTEIGEAAFGDCKPLKKINLPEGLTTIGANAFSGSGIESITIPGSVKTIDSSCFFCSNDLKTIEIQDGVEVLDGCFSGIASITDVIIHSKNLTIGSCTFAGCSSLTNISFPSEGNIIIENDAFNSCTSLTNLTISGSVKSIGTTAFASCSNLTNITLENGIETLKDFCFAGSAISEITIPKTVTSIDEYALTGIYNMKQINVDEENTTYCSIDGVLYNKDKTILVQYPPQKDKSTYTVADTVTEIWAGAFWEAKNLININIPNNISEIKDRVFKDCNSLTNVNLPNTVTKIGYSAFSGCTGITNLIVPSTVTTIGSEAFKGVPQVTYSGTATGSPWGATKVVSE